MEPSSDTCADTSGDESNPHHNFDDVDDLMKQMAKLWWHDSDQEKADTGISPNLRSDNDDSNGEILYVEKPKYLASLSLQSNMERVWAKELYELDAIEREDIVNEIHGVQSSRTVQETPGVISEGVQSLRDYIDQNEIVPGVTREVYERVLSSELIKGGKKVPYIRTQNFLLKFMRASHFDVEKAGLRYFRCLDMLHSLFGDFALTRPLVMTDLTVREIRYLRKGQMQLLPSRDRVGRRIFAFTGREDNHFTIREKYRTCMYLFDVCSEDETTQKLGIVLLHFPKIDPGAKPFGEDGMALRSKKHEMLGGLTEREFYHKFHDARPLRTSALHFTGPDTFIYHIGKSLILLLLGKEDRKIVRFHGGSQMECNYSLKSFGIPSDVVPVTDDGQIKNKKVTKFIAARKSIEAIRQQQRGSADFEITYTKSHACAAIECPDVNCIIFGNWAQHNAANLEFRNILNVMERDREEKIAGCESVPSAKEFINAIIQTTKSPEHNLRFVAIDKKTSFFVEIEDSQELYATVSQALRDQRKRMRLGKKLSKTTNQGNNRRQRSKEDESFFANYDDHGSAGSIMGFGAAKRQKGSSNGCCDLSL